MSLVQVHPEDDQNGSPMADQAQAELAELRHYAHRMTAVWGMVSAVADDLGRAVDAGLGDLMVSHAVRVLALLEATRQVMVPPTVP